MPIVRNIFKNIKHIEKNELNVNAYGDRTLLSLGCNGCNIIILNQLSFKTKKII